MILNGEFFSEKSKEYNEKTLDCIKESVEKLEKIGDRSLMMLGKIQSGKTKSFIGVMALAFDNGYDLSVVLTKNSNALVKQTVSRLKDEFKDFREEDMVEVFDIMCMPPNMSKFELDKKLIIVVKKEKNNIPKLIDFIERYSLYKNKKCLIIDDEADFCSIGYDKKKDIQEFDLRKIASQINELRLQLTCRFVQVTATPYSLYLQPENIDLNNNQEIKPIKPAETVLVPYGDGYIGGDYYFDREKYPLGEYLFEKIEKEELEIIKKVDRRRFKNEEILTSPKIKGLRNAIINFIIAGCIRIIQNGGRLRGKNNKFSFIIHTEISKAAHTRQEELVTLLIEKLVEEAKIDSKLLNEYIDEGYENFKKSVDAYGFTMPEKNELREYVKRAISEEWISSAIVNSENDINAILDEDGQLKLRTPLNIFIGGQILDRGITISNLIGFYYGRSPQKMQQDTVLQHSRMYGYRKKEDLSVTRFYTTIEIFEVMSNINEFDSKLREDFEQGNFNQGVIFISKDEKGKIIPCSPDKIKISNTKVLKPWKVIVPYGFSTKSKTYIKSNINKIDNILRENNDDKIEGTFKVSLDTICNIVELFYDTIEIERENCVDKESFISLLKYLSKKEVNILCKANRNISKFKENGNYADVPYDGKGDIRIAKELASENPVIILTKQNGKKENGWKDAEFYWPVLFIQSNIKTAVYTSEIFD